MRSKIYQAKNPQERLNAILALCDVHYNIPRDTLDKYAYEAYSLALQTGNDSLIALGALSKAQDYYRWGWLDSATVLIEEIVPRLSFQDPSTSSVYFKLMRLKAISKGGRMDYPGALDILYRLVNEAEKIGDKLNLAINQNSIASIALARDQADEALIWIRKAEVLLGESNEFQTVKASIFVNKSNAFLRLAQEDSALFYINQGVELSKQINNLPIYSMALQRKSELALKKGNLIEAENSLIELLEARKLTGDQNLYTDDKEALLNFYLKSGQYQKVIDLANTILQGTLTDPNTLDSKTLTNSINLRLIYFEALGKAYKASGDSEKYQETLEEIIQAKDVFYTQNSERALAELQTQYEVQQKENTIIQQQLDLIRRQRVAYGTFAALAIVILLATLLMVFSRRKEKIERVKFQEAEKFKAQKSILEAKEQERKRISSDLHDNLGAFAASITSNLEYIKDERLDDLGKRALRELQINSRSMISELNDTIWALKNDSLSLTALSDRLKLYLQRLNSSYPEIQINFIEEIMEDRILPAAEAFNLFRILQEAINNALRHSDCRQLRIQLKSNDSWSIEVADNGKGLNQELSTSAGNGLENMKKRARNSGWKISWQGIIGASGTSVRIEPTTN
ncbi:ATP-binding protein [Algoriphagus sp.]|uniref:tetratricopeptide repeat-containing sensor histidine kinase n=1 Tax=Algoriphagus sp. TaxID=1872435 RepID=UPI00391895D5